MEPLPHIANLRHLRMLQVIGRTHGVGQAARELNSSQPAVTLAVSTIEAELGHDVFERGGNGSYPTAIGRPYLLRVNRFFEIIDTALAAEMAAPRKPVPSVERLLTSTQIRALIGFLEPRHNKGFAGQAGISETAMQRSVRAMEKALGLSLFNRSAHGPNLSDAGISLARQFKCAARELEMAREEIRFTVGEADMEITIGALPMSASYELAEAIRRFTSRQKRARIKILIGEYDALLEDLSRCRIDMIVGLLRCPDWATDLSKEELYRDSYCIVTRPGHPLTALKTITPTDLIGHGWIVPPEGTPRRRQIEALFDGIAEKPSFNIETRSLVISRALLLESNLITVMTRSEIQVDARLGLIQCLPCAELKTIPAKGVATRTNWLPTPLHADFLDVLREVTAALH